MMVTQRWDPIVMITHWCVVVGFLLNRLEITSPGSSWHKGIGLFVGALVLLRLLWGLTLAKGPARLSAILPTLAAVKHHVQEVRDRSAHQTLGHNPMGAMAIWAIWGGLLLIALTGLLQDSTLADNWPISDLHSFLVDAVTVVVVLHITAVVSLSLWLKRSLIKTMLPW